MPVQINKEDFAKPWRPGVYPKSTTVIYNNQLWILNDAITGLFSSSDFLAEVVNGDWIGRYITENDLPTIINDKNYVHNQIVASNSWEIQHNLDKYPSVSIVDSGNNLVIGEIKYIDSNNIIITFTAVFSGKAYFN